MNKITKEHKKRISVIIPVFEEAMNMQRWKKDVQAFTREDLEWIVVDGGSTDGTRQKAAWANHVVTGPRGRALQMNRGAELAQGDILLFLHSDVILPRDWMEQIEQGLLPGAFGTFDFVFEGEDKPSRFLAWLRRKPFLFMKGGDQGLVVWKKDFERLGGFSERHVIMEDYEIIQRYRKSLKQVLFSGKLCLSNRKFKRYKGIRIVWAFWTTYILFYLGLSPIWLERYYAFCIPVYQSRHNYA